MANATSHVPWVCDSAGTLMTTPVKLIEIVWEEPDTDGHTLQVQDSNGNRVWHYTCPTSGTGVSFSRNIGTWVTGGLKIATIDSGTVLFYIE